MRRATSVAIVRGCRVVLVSGSILFALAHASSAQSIAGRIPDGIKPAWNKGIQPINQENYWNAVACGKQGGARPACVFYDADVCKNDDFELALFTPYKMVAYEVWRVVRQGQEAPTPSYSEAQRTRITLKVTPKPAAKNPLSAFTLKRGDKAVAPVSRSNDAGAASYTFDFPAFAPTDTVTLEMAGRARTVSCVLDRATLLKFR
jgi:hypothetical protein